MLMKSDSNSNSSAATACGNCGVEERRLLHHVRHRGIFRRLCTSCVLRLHPQYFCPTCFQVYIPAPSNHEVITCYKCYSSAHSHCVSVGAASTPSPYVCPLCIDPNTPIFKLKTSKEASVGIDGEMHSRSGDCKVMNRDEAKKLLAAAKIASASMNKAAVAAKVEAERRAKEAAFTRKKAKEALEHVAYLVVEEKLRKNKAGVAGSGTSVGIGVPQSKIEVDVNFKKGFSNGIVASGRCPLVVMEERINSVENMDDSSQVLAALDADESIEGEQMDEIKAECVGSEVLPDDDNAVMDVVVEGSMMVSDEDNNLGFTSKGNNSNDSCCSSFVDENSGALNTDESVLHEIVDEIKEGMGSEVPSDECNEMMDGNVEECTRVSDEENVVGLDAKCSNGIDSCHSSFVDEKIGALKVNESVLHEKMDEIKAGTIQSEAPSDNDVEVMDEGAEGSERMNDVESSVGCATERNNGNDSCHFSSLDENCGVLNVDELVGHETKAEGAGSEVAEDKDIQRMDGDVEGSMRVGDEENIVGFDAKQNSGNDSCHSSFVDGNSGAVDAYIKGQEHEDANDIVVLIQPVSDEMRCVENSNGKEHSNVDQL